MDQAAGEGIFKRYRIVNGHRILSGCLYCQGALFGGHKPLGAEGLEVYKCFQCGRMYISTKNGYIRLWPYRNYEHLSSQSANRSQPQK